MKIHIPEPCSENWDKMTPQGDGRHCLSCDKVVTDFTNMTTEEIQNYFKIHSDRKICGIFNREDTTYQETFINQKDEQNGIFVFVKKLIAASFLGSLLIFASCKTKQRLTGAVAPQQLLGGIDSDNDGIADLLDECPYVGGKPEYFGCPDSDGDGIGDSKDRCPNEAGEINNNGCPSNNNQYEIMGKVHAPEDYIHHEIVNYQRGLWFKDGEIEKIIENIGDFKSSHLRLEIKIVMAAKDSPKLYENRKNQLLRMLKDYMADIEKAEFEKIINDEKQGQVYFKLKQ